MADSEKLTALKKAYAEIILNTAKEAAARIMVSERKALRYQQELFAAKDEALLMLLRLKQMLDAKVIPSYMCPFMANEAEMMSLNQQKRIDELEAQLGEAEDIVRDLRADLREAQDELEKLTKEKMQCIDNQKSENDVAVSLEISQENRVNNFGSATSSLPDAETDIVTVFDMKSSVPNETDVGNKCSCTNNCYVCNPDFASIVMRRKEPDLYRNGCTQRIRALERCLLNGISGQVDDAKNEKAREGEEGSDMHTKPSLGADMCRPEEKTEELKTMRSDVYNNIQILPLSSFHRKRKRAARYKKNKAPSSMNIHDQVVARCEESDLFCPETFSDAADGNVQSGEQSRIIEHDVLNNPHCPMPSSPLDPAEGIIQSSYEVVDKNDGEIVKACDFQNEKSDDKLLTDRKELPRRESGSAESLGVPSCKMDIEMVDVSADNLDVKVSEITEGSSSQPANNKFIMYTFKRKRKKESFSSPDRDSSLDDGTSQRNAEEKQNGQLDSEKATLITETSRDSRRLVQVARQGRSINRFRPQISFQLTWYMDRFIPCRSAMDFGSALVKLTERETIQDPQAVVSPASEAYRKALAEALNMNRTRILAFNNRPPIPVQNFTGDLEPAKSAKQIRRIPQCPDRTLDVPDLVDDFGLNLLDWGSSDVKAIALGNMVYLEGHSGDSKLVTGLDEDGIVASVSWAPDGRRIAIGLDNSEVQLWDAASNQKLRTLRGCHAHGSRVGSMAWNNHVLTTGGMDGLIVNNDERMSSHIVDSYEGHTLEVCGLKWSASGQRLASGGSDNLVHIWDRSMASSNLPTKCLHRLDHHTSAVKALAWCPFQSNLLASGGGEGDGSIKFWNIQTGECLNSVDTDSEVSALLWSKTERELLSSHGYDRNQLILWRYPSMIKMAELAHTSRVLYMAQSPDGCTVASAGEDETLRFWNVFGVPKIPKPTPKLKPEPFPQVNHIR
ncbi:hypothetical protein CCACVL1_11536 [Corchorus capsularis]|uniref:CDC20/Fizzy WD40 domain-containing protein n=1 Tax=Corchorus capsularis TaxID=210143 RepID=A0A1R3IKN0_COCAP|nr:hypothetical protein CCACVL1_11536 [Corchorus capsularis]